MKRGELDRRGQLGFPARTPSSSTGGGCTSGSPRRRLWEEQKDFIEIIHPKPSDLDLFPCVGAAPAQDARRPFLMPDPAFWSWALREEQSF